MKYGHLLRCLPFLFSVLFPFLFAQEDGDTQKKGSELSEPHIEESLIVWGTEVRTSSARLGDDLMAIRQPDHVSDLLRTVPGIDVGGAHSLNQRITIRGMDDKDLRISIDGASQNSYMYHHMGNLQIHADILKSVDIEVGNNSVVHGGIGGSVRFQTRSARDLLEPDQRWGARLLGSYGENDSQGFSATGYGLLHDNVDVLIYHHLVARDDYRVGGDEIKDSTGALIPGTDGRVRGHEGDLNDTLIRFGWTFAEHHRLELGYEIYADEGHYSYRPDMGLATDLAIADNLGLPLTYPTEFTRDTLTLNYTAFLGSNTTVRATAFHNESTLWRDEQGVAAVFGGESVIEGLAENQGFNLLATTLLGTGIEHQLNYGVDVVLYETRYTTDGVQASSEDVTRMAVFIEDRIQWTPRFLLVPGLRYDRADLNATLNDDQYSEITAGLATEVRLSEQVLLRAGTTRIFKAPEIGEVFLGAGLYDTPNPDIESETGFNSEIALAYSNDLDNEGRFTAGFTLFRTDIDDYIYDYAGRADGFRGKDNVGDMQNDGIEAYIGYQQGAFQSLLGFSASDSELSAFDVYPDLEGARLDRQQGDTFSLNLDYQFATGLTLHADSLLVSGVDAGLNLDGATRDNAKDHYSVHNISARWTPQTLKGLSLVLGVDNLLDEYYASQSSRTGVSFHPRFGELYLVDYEPGRNVKTTLAWRF